MWRALAFLVVITAALGALLKLKPQTQRPVFDGYWEMRLKIRAGNRDLDLVALGDRPLMQECEGGAPKLALPQFCTDAVHCATQDFQCEREIAPRYQRMLDMQPANLHYLHYAMQTSEGLRRVIIVGWGMTEAESAEICKRLEHEAGPKQNEAVAIHCI